MGLCNSKPSPNSDLFAEKSGSRTPNEGSNSTQPNSVTAMGGASPLPPSSENGRDGRKTGNRRSEIHEMDNVKKSPFFPFYSPSPAHYLFSKKSPARSPANASANSTPKRFFRKPFPPPSPAKHIRAVLARRHGSVKPNEVSIPEGSEAEGVTGLDKNFGFSKHLGSKYELGEEVGRGHFGYTCAAKFKKGELKGQQVAVKIIPKSKVFDLFLLHYRFVLCNHLRFCENVASFPLKMRKLVLCLDQLLVYLFVLEMVVRDYANFSFSDSSLEHSSP